MWNDIIFPLAMMLLVAAGCALIMTPLAAFLFHARKKRTLGWVASFSFMLAFGGEIILLITSNTSYGSYHYRPYDPAPILWISAGVAIPLLIAFLLSLGLAKLSGVKTPGARSIMNSVIFFAVLAGEFFLVSMYARVHDSYFLKKSSPDDIGTRYEPYYTADSYTAETPEEIKIEEKRTEILEKLRKKGVVDESVYQKNVPIPETQPAEEVYFVRTFTPTTIELGSAAEPPQQQQAPIEEQTTEYWRPTEEQQP